MIAMVGAIALNFTSEKGMRDQDFLFQSSRSTEISVFNKGSEDSFEEELSVRV
jgi:hypothetical protein